MAFKNLWRELPPTVQHTFSSNAKRFEFKRAATIYSAGDRPAGLYFVEQGLIGLKLLGLSGKEHLLRFFRPGEFFGHRSLLLNEPYHGNTTAIEPSQVLMIPGQVVIDSLNHHPLMYRDLALFMARELGRCESQHVQIIENEVMVRIAQAIIYLKEVHPDHTWTRQEIADFCASTAPTVIKTLAELENRRLIRQSGRNIEILDRDGLLGLQDE